MKIETVCDAAFQPMNPDVIVTIGKEHLAWWNIYPEGRNITMQCKADYDVSVIPTKAIKIFSYVLLYGPTTVHFTIVFR